MPSTSAKQAKFMRAVAHSPKFAKKVGVPQSVGKDFEMADKKKKVKKFGSGGWSMDLPRKNGSSIEKLPTKMPSKDGDGIKKLPTKMPSKDGSGIKKLSDGGDTARVKKLKGPGPARPLEFPIRGRSISIPLDEPKPTPRKIPPKITKTAPVTPVNRDEARKYREELKKVKVSPAEGRVIESANRSEGGGHKKGGMIMKKSDKAGRALVKKSADTMGRAMVKKKAGGGSCYAKGGTASARADGIAKKGKTKGKMLAGGGLTLGNRMPAKLGSSGPSNMNPTQSGSGNPGQVMRANASRNPQNMGARFSGTGRKKGGMVGKKNGGVVKKAAGGLTLGNRMVTDTGSGMRASSGPVTLGNNRMVDTGNGRMLSLGGMKPGQSITNSRPTKPAGPKFGMYMGSKKGGMVGKKKGGKC